MVHNSINPILYNKIVFSLENEVRTQINQQKNEWQLDQVQTTTIILYFVLPDLFISFPKPGSKLF